MSSPWYRRPAARRLAVYATAALAIQILALLVWIVRFYMLEDHTAPMVGFDFGVFWSAARVTLAHGATAVFSMQWMQPIEVSVWHAFNYAPWPYPPTFLLAVFPFGLLPFGAALVLYSVLGLCIYWGMLTRLGRHVDRVLWPLLAAFPGLCVALGLGQNTLLTVGAAGAALALLEIDSALAGVCIAALAIKPQFGVLFPLALACSGQWKVFSVAALCALGFGAISALAFGGDAWTAFATYLPEFRRLAVEEGGPSMWIGMPTVFAISRSLGLPVNAAYLAHALVAAPAVVAMAFLWARRARFELCASAFVVATLLMQPYVMFYDLAWLILPIVLLLRDAKAQPLHRVEWLVLAAAWLAPLQGVLAAYLGRYLQVVPVVLVGLLAMVMRRYWTSVRAQEAGQRMAALRHS
ncbi:glycosyltransferase family 87 protein [Ralstonia sp. UBA689]|uniref:glycosyltransferase family 87 protein n=1 Tax=Ralstonia sp. UBA689 TaxID=1947373 RepID=UPI0025E19D97|nr:glycosyltransferase family 87 protein [Ralstonia sp. UBA689]